MMRRLWEKGWSETELHDFMQRITPKKEHRALVLAAFVLLGGVAIAVPFAYGVYASVFTSILFYTLLAVLGLSFGATIGLLFVDLERIDHKHHVVLLAVIPLLLFVSSNWFMSRGFSFVTQLFSHNALIGGLVYAFSFTLTYAVMVVYGWNSRIGQ